MNTGVVRNLLKDAGNRFLATIPYELEPDRWNWNQKMPDQAEGPHNFHDSHL